MTIKEKREHRLKLAQQARAILATAEGAGRALSAEEQASYDKIWAEMQSVKGQIDTEEKLEAEERELAASQGARAGGAQRSDGSGGPGNAAPRILQLRRSSTGEARAITLSGELASPEYEATYRRFLTGGPAALGGAAGALQMDSDSGGGYLVAPQQFQGEVIMALDNEVFMRQISRLLPPLVSAESLGAPSLDNDPADPDWTAEVAIGTEDSTMSFGKRELKPHPLAKFLKASKSLVRRSAVPVETIIRDRLAYKFGTTMEYNYLNGDGATKPLGVFFPSANGIPTSRDVSAGNEATSIKADGLINAKFALKAQYRRSGNPRWIFHRDAVKQISTLKDGEGRYLWLPSTRDGEPDRILNVPYIETEYAPSTFTTGKYVGIIGDFRYYWIVDALTMTIQVLVELYAGANQNGYLGRMESDGMPVLGEAFARVKLG